MCFLLDVLIGCSSILFILISCLSLEQYISWKMIIVLIVNSFMLGLELSYLDKKGKCCGNYSAHSFGLPVLRSGFLFADMMS